MMTSHNANKCKWYGYGHSNIKIHRRKWNRQRNKNENEEEEEEGNNFTILRNDQNKIHDTEKLWTQQSQIIVILNKQIITKIIHLFINNFCF